jgi:hypothetical protein
MPRRKRPPTTNDSSNSEPLLTDEQWEEVLRRRWIPEDVIEEETPEEAYLQRAKEWGEITTVGGKFLPNWWEYWHLLIALQITSQGDEWLPTIVNGMHAKWGGAVTIELLIGYLSGPPWHYTREQVKALSLEQLAEILHPAPDGRGRTWPLGLVPDENAHAVRRGQKVAGFLGRSYA